MANLLTDPEFGQGQSWGGLHQALVTPQLLHLLQGLPGVDSQGGAGGQVPGPCCRTRRECGPSLTSSWSGICPSDAMNRTMSYFFPDRCFGSRREKCTIEVHALWLSLGDLLLLLAGSPLNSCRPGDYAQASPAPGTQEEGLPGGQADGLIPCRYEYTI